MIYCKNCGDKIEQEANFCHMCGKKVIDENPKEKESVGAKPIKSIKSNKLKIGLTILTVLFASYFMYMEMIKTKCEGWLVYLPATGPVTSKYYGTTAAKEGYYSARGGQYKTADDAIRGCVAGEKFKF
jgi:hypothetical protein